MGSGIVMMKQYTSCQVAWTFSANCIPKLQQNLTDDAEFTFAPHFWKSQNTVSITFPAEGITLNFFVVDELGCFHCIEAHFVLGWLWCTRDSSPVTILLSKSSPSSPYHKRCCKDRPIQFIFSQSFGSLGTHHAHTFQNFKWSYIMLNAQPWEHPNAVATLSVVILLSAWINFSTRCTSHHKQETFLCGYPLHWVLLPTKNTQPKAALR
jgi:hypothetical protein